MGLVTNGHFENRRGEGPGDEVGSFSFRRHIGEDPGDGVAYLAQRLPLFGRGYIV